MPAATYYLDSAGNNSDGSTWAKAYTTLAGALAVLAANSGDTIKFRGTLAGANCQGTWGNAGSSAGRVYLVGCNAAGTEDGTRAVLDLSGTGTILTIGAKNCITIRNVTFRRATQGCTLSGTQYSLVLVNCLFELNSSAGLNAVGIGAYGSLVRRCTFSNNTYAGCSGPNAAVYEYCYVNNNGANASTYGIYGDYIGAYGCVFVANTSANAVYALAVGYSNYGGKQVEHCVFYGNKFGVYFPRGSQYQTMMFNKFLSNTTGINVLTGSHILLENNGWNGNGAKYALAGTGSVEAVTGEIDMAADGCVNAAAGNFNNSATSEGLFVATSIDGTNYTYEHIGLPYKPAPVSTSSASFSSCSDSSNSFSESSASYASPSASSQSSRSQSSGSQSSKSDSSDSSSFVVTAGTDSIQAQITNHIKTALRSILSVNGYNYDISAVEESRKQLEINDRWPFILLLEEDPVKDEESLVIRELQYTLWFFPAQDDRVTGDAIVDLNTEIAHYCRNAIPDITKALSVDLYRGVVDGHTSPRAEITEVIPGTADLYVDDVMVLYGVWCKVRVVTNIDATNPYLLRQGV